MDSEKLQPDMRRQSVHLLVALGIFLILVFISLIAYLEIIPFV